MEVDLGKLKLALESLRINYESKEVLSSDPILFPAQYPNPKDRELVALLSALFAYGNVKSIQSFLNNLLTPLGPYPFHEIQNNTKKFHTLLNSPPYYRFQTSEDIRIFLLSIQSFVETHKQGPIFEDFFLDDKKVFLAANGISNFQSTFVTKIQEQLGKKPFTNGLQFLIGKPEAKTPKKRICLFLRWMVRKDFPDFGLYIKINPADLPYPADVHIQKLAKVLGISKSKTFSLKDSINLSEVFKQINPEDPLLYDFHLTRVGILEKCLGKYNFKICGNCKLNGVCLVVPRGIEPRLQG